jgi:hypothetical protein
VAARASSSRKPPQIPRSAQAGGAPFADAPIVRSLVALAVLAVVVLPLEQEAKLVTVALIFVLASLLLRARPARL